MIACALYSFYQGNDWNNTYILTLDSKEAIGKKVCKMKFGWGGNFYRQPFGITHYRWQLRKYLIDGLIDDISATRFSRIIVIKNLPSAIYHVFLSANENKKRLWHHSASAQPCETPNTAPPTHIIESRNWLHNIFCKQKLKWGYEESDVVQMTISLFLHACFYKSSSAWSNPIFPEVASLVHSDLSGCSKSTTYLLW